MKLKLLVRYIPDISIPANVIDVGFILFYPETNFYYAKFDGYDFKDISEQDKEFLQEAIVRLKNKIDQKYSITELQEIYKCNNLRVIDIETLK